MHKLMLTNPECKVPEFDKAPWDEMVLITPQNSVCNAWNRLSVCKHCARTGNVLYIFDAEDTIGDSGLSLNMEQKVVMAGMKLSDSKESNGTKKLAHRLEVVIGMKFIITLNLAMAADLANGSRGTITNIILDPREDMAMNETNSSGKCWLQYPPAIILFKPLHYKFEPFLNLEPGVILIFPSEVMFNIYYHNDPKTKIRRRQYALSTGYAFTDHKSQGQTLEHVVIDIGPTKWFLVDPFAAYVALSRSRGCKTIRLLQDFDPSIFTKHPSEALRLEDEHLNNMAEETSVKFKAGCYKF